MSGLTSTLEGGNEFLDEMAQHFIAVMFAGFPGWFGGWILAYNLFDWNNIVAVITPIILLPWMLSLDYAFNPNVFQDRIADERGGIQTVKQAKGIAAYYNVLAFSAILFAAIAETLVHVPIDAWWWGTGTFVVGSVILGDRFYFDTAGVSPILRASALLAGDIEPSQIPITANLYQYANEEWDLGL